MPLPPLAVILAAGMGERLRGVWEEPKGLLQIGGQTLVERSVAALRARGVQHILIVAGYRAEAYQRFAEGQPDLEVLLNRGYVETGSMASLDVALDRAGDDFLLLESDLFYDPAALDAIAASPARDLVLASGFTGAGDEVWIEAPEGRLRGLSKERERLRSVEGEFVGIARVSGGLAHHLRTAYQRFTGTQGHGRMAYDTEALPQAAAQHPVAMLLLPGLLWGEIDVEEQLVRVRDHVWPEWQARSGER